MGHGNHGGTNKARQSKDFKSRRGKDGGGHKLSRSQRMQTRKRGGANGDTPREHPGTPTYRN